MQTALSTKGQVVVPGSVRRRLNLHPGHAFGVEVEDGRIGLTPLGSRKYVISIQTDRETGMAVAVAVAGAPMLTSEQVSGIPRGFP